MMGKKLYSRWRLILEHVTHVLADCHWCLWSLDQSKLDEYLSRLLIHSLSQALSTTLQLYTVLTIYMADAGSLAIHPAFLS